MSDIVIGVDGGGTKTVAWIAPLEDADNTVVLGRGKAGPGNPRSVGFETAQSNIAAAIEAAFDDAALPRVPAAAAWFGLAGAGREVEQGRISAWAVERQLANRVRVSGDVELVLGAASRDFSGIAFACGTGSMAWGRSREGQVGRCGGWGYLLGDEGSSYAIAIAALNAIVRAADGRGPATALTERFLNANRLASAKELVDFVYSPAMNPPALASGAMFVFEVAETDGVAKQIIETGAEESAHMIAALARRMGLGRSFTLGMSGSACVKQPTYRERILDRLAARNVRPASVEVVAEPVRGAVALARALADGRVA
jgi:N-acetylmuramic acid 6-phosphate etherase